MRTWVVMAWVQHTYLQFLYVCFHIHHYLSVYFTVTVEDFYDNDNGVYGQLDASHWLRIVSSCLQASKEVARRIRKGLCSVNMRGLFHVLHAMLHLIWIYVRKYYTS